MSKQHTSKSDKNNKQTKKEDKISELGELEEFSTPLQIPQSQVISSSPSLSSSNKQDTISSQVSSLSRLSPLSPLVLPNEKSEMKEEKILEKAPEDQLMNEHLEKKDEDVDLKFSIREYLKGELDGKTKRKIQSQEVLINLKLISKLETGSKINFKGQNGITITGVEEYSFLPFFIADRINNFFRYLGKEKGRREMIIFFFENISAAIEKIEENLQDSMFCDEFIHHLGECITGLKKSKITYKNDHVYESCIDTLISYEINLNLRKLKERGLKIDLKTFLFSQNIS